MTVTTAPAITYRKTKSGTWVAYGPADSITAGATVTVTKRSGDTKQETIQSVGKVFTVDGTRMVYGYLEPTARPAKTANRFRSYQSCAECGSGRGYIERVDMSGLTGMVCGRCNREDFLSFA